ncbi:hypothetical protein F5Y00DRAFT_260049 [Daldinia vernicosa]|uniref:uncharacterized protein n=1 Tax=Daldinia vernicosa TaxID=114800 RepID=UPI0020087D73|nr:uncharacterized protein F5Y00DRAFT_260049 [Daldinia vernicosa]KAI0851030.1 hypothetical protein F5Y00DRAFT_260049 [Daldinia vernicosa]
MASLRERLRRRTTTRPEVDVEDSGCLTDPPMPSPTKDRHVIAEKLRAKQYSLRRRFVLGLDRKKSLPILQQHIEHSQVCEENQDPQPSLIRKSINSFSSSLRDRFSSDTSTGSDDQGRRPSVIRKSISSISSSLRGIRSSISSQLSQDGSTEYQTSPENTGTLINFPGIPKGIPRRNSLGHISSTSSGRDSVPRLPDLDTMVANIKVGEKLHVDRSPKAVAGQGEPIVRQPSPIPERFFVRIKRPDPAVAERRAGPRASQEDLPTAASDGGSVDYPVKDSVNLDGTPKNWKVPMHRIDHILETSVIMRGQGYQPYKPIPDYEIRERLRRIESRVYVFIPDKSDNSKPWPRKRYPDLETALKDLCTRFKPYYSSFAAFAPEVRAIQLFSPNFRPPESRYVGSPMDGRSEEEEEMTESTTPQTGSSIATESEIYTIQEYKRPYVYDADKASLDDDNIRDPGISALAKHKLGSSEESLLTDDYDMAIASKMGFYP